MPHKQQAFDLKILNRVAQALAETKDLKELKSLRDKAEAARQYIENARLGQSLQNYAAELKLRAERRIGKLLIELIPHGGNRRSSSHDGNLKLADLGINANQSSRWRRETAVPEAGPINARLQALMGVADKSEGLTNAPGVMQRAFGRLRAPTVAKEPHTGEKACPEKSNARAR